MIEDKDILQADAAVIAGVLIFLSIYSALPRRGRWRTIRILSVPAIIFAVIPFSLSALYILNSSFFDIQSAHYHQDLRCAKSWAKIGFEFTIVLPIAWIAILPIIYI